MWYIILLIILTIMSVFVCLMMHKFKNKKLCNFIFATVILGFYWAIVLYVYFDVGLYDWNFQETLPVANISPFMFFSVVFCFLLPKKIRKYHFTLIAILSVGMIFSPSIGCLFNAARNYRFIPLSFLFDYIAHFAMFLWGIYLVKSNQVQLKIKECLISGSLIILVSLTMIVLNVIFDTAFFGLSLNGKHNIYGKIMVSNSYLSALIYLSGLIVVLLLGFLFQKYVVKKTH